jgi:hypothetical protein
MAGIPPWPAPSNSSSRVFVLPLLSAAAANRELEFLPWLPSSSAPLLSHPFSLKPAPSPTTSPWPSSSSARPLLLFPLVQQQEAPARSLGVQLRCAAVPIQNSGPGSPPHCVLHQICAAPTSTPFTSMRRRRSLFDSVLALFFGD